MSARFPTARSIVYNRLSDRTGSNTNRKYKKAIHIKSDNKIKTTWNIIKREMRKTHLTEQMPSLLTHNEKVKVSTIASKQHIQQIRYQPALTKPRVFQQKKKRKL
jgi:hypothetical protein